MARRLASMCVREIHITTATIARCTTLPDTTYACPCVQVCKRERERDLHTDSECILRGGTQRPAITNPRMTPRPTRKDLIFTHHRLYKTIQDTIQDKADIAQRESGGRSIRPARSKFLHGALVNVFVEARHSYNELRRVCCKVFFKRLDPMFGVYGMVCMRCQLWGGHD